MKPMPESVKRAFWQGFWAEESGLPKFNPYFMFPESMEFVAWESGWEADQ